MQSRSVFVWAALFLLPGRLFASGVLDVVGTIPSGCAYDSDTAIGDFVVSPDGADLYSPGPSKVHRFRRNPSTGALTFAPAFSDPVLPAYDPYFSTIRSTVTPDGRHLILLQGKASIDGTTPDRFVVLGRDTMTGDLAVVQELETLIPGYPEFLVSPDGSNVYATTGASDQAGWALARSFRRFARDAVTGTLSELGNTPALVPDGGYAAFVSSGDGLQIYALGARSIPGGSRELLDVWARDPVTGDLSPVQGFEDFVDGVSGLGDPTDVVVSPDGTDLYALKKYYWDPPRIAHFRRSPATGLLTFVGVVVETGLFSLGGAELHIRADGAFLYVGQSWQTAVLARDAVTGDLTFAGTLTKAGEPSELTADGDHYGFFDGSLIAHRLDGSTGLGWIVDVENRRADLGAIAVTPDGAHLYVTCPWEDAVAGFAIDPDTGELTPAGKLVDGGGGFAGISTSFVENPIVVSPDGAHVYVGSLHGAGIATLARNAVTGELTFVSAVLQDHAGIDGVERVQHLAMSSDGSHLYTSGGDFEHVTLAAFARDAGTGALTQVQVLPRPIPDRITDRFVSGITVPADGAHVYVAGASFRRDPITGRLEDEQALQIGGLWPTAQAAGTQIYFAGGDIRVKRRDPLTGRLSDVQNFSRPGIDVLTPLTVGGDGLYAHAMSRAYPDPLALVTWRRDPVSGQLALVHSQPAGAGLGNRSVVTSLDGRHVYKLDDTNGVVHYRRRQPCAPAPLPGCRVPTQAGAATMTLTDQPGTTRNAMKLRWSRGTAVTLADLGAPHVSTDYAACLYDAAGPQPVAALLAPAGEACRRGPCWTQRAQGFTYLDIDRTPDGVARAIFKPGAAGQSSLRWQANKGAVPPLGLPLQSPVVIQIQASNGTCWEAKFSTPTMNDGLRWQAKSD